MKRSEMVNELADILAQLFAHDDYYIAADGILKRLENLGMAPPKISLGELKRGGHVYNNEWELEND